MEIDGETVEKIEHTPGPYIFSPPIDKADQDLPSFDDLSVGKTMVILGVWHNNSTAGVGIESLQDAVLIERFNEVPHSCGIPGCPGSKNLAMIQAAEGLAKACEAWVDGHLLDCTCDYCRSLRQWRDAVQ